jgi:DNA-binding transcriptional LysR family regulator
MLQFDEVMLGSIEIFCLAAELGNFTLAAKQAGVTPAAVSRSVSRLEGRLKVALFVRSTRSMRLTDAGKLYLQHCRSAIAQIAEAEGEITGQQTNPSGLIRISMAQPYGQFRLMPILAAFREKYPDVEFQLHLNNHNIDFTNDAYDIAVRGRTQPDSGLIARKLEDAPLVTVAAPAYLRKTGAPTSPDELSDHDCIQFILPSSGQPVRWSYSVGGQDKDIATQGNTSCTDDPLGCVQLARLGCGLLQTYKFIVESDLQSGALVEVLTEFAGRSRPFSLLYPQNRNMPHRIRTLVEFVLAHLK